MSKGTTTKVAPVDLTRYCRSTFTLTFAVEILGMEVWHDCNEGWVDLGPFQQGMKIQYQLYPGQVFDVDILIWPHVAKIWCSAGNSGWVRTWQFLERRFLTFSIRHIFPVRVVELQNFTATITPTVGTANLGSNAKNDKNDEIFVPPLKFGDLRYFAPLVAGESLLTEYMADLIWHLVVNYIPASPLDGVFDVPGPVTDVRHQDTIMYYVKEAILNKVKKEIIETPEPEQPKAEDRRESKMIKEKEKVVKKTEAPKIKFEIKLHGDSILAGVGRIVQFVKFGDHPNELGEFIAIISSTNLPAQDDQPIIFVNIDTLSDAPLEHFRKLRISHVYTRWIIGKEVHDSELQIVKPNKTDIMFNDHHALLMNFDLVSQNTAGFLDNPFQVQLRGVKVPGTYKEQPRFFGYKKGDQNFGTSSCKLVQEDTDFLIAVTKIDARCMTKGINKFIRGNYPLFPPTVSVVELGREGSCSNDVNNIRAPKCPNLVVPPYVVLEAQMSLEVSMGFVGCQPKKLSETLSRLFCFINDTESIMTLLKVITEINTIILKTDNKDDILTGFALDVGDIVLLYIEGPSDGMILRVWETTENFHSKVKAMFSSSTRYATRMYPAYLMTVPFNVLKMYVPLGVILACPPVYATPALPVLTRTALLKFGRLIGNKLRAIPTRNDMPSVSELKSFKLELCAAPRPVIGSQAAEASKNGSGRRNTLQKINWDEHRCKTNENQHK